MDRYLTQGLIIGIALGVLVGLFFVFYYEGDWSWLIFGVTLGIAMGFGIGLHFREKSNSP